MGENDDRHENIDKMTTGVFMRVLTPTEMARQIAFGAIKYILQDDNFSRWLAWMAKVQLEGGAPQETADKLLELTQQEVAESASVAAWFVDLGLEVDDAISRLQASVFAGPSPDVEVDLEPIPLGKLHNEDGVDTETSGPVE